MENTFFSLSGKNRVRASRFDLDGRLRVNSKTIGSNLSFDLSPENISKTGMLLTWNSTVKTPFSEKTIVDLTVDPEAKLFRRPLKCLGKVVRKFEQNGQESFGIRIVQMELEDVSLWESALRFLGNQDGEALAAG